MRRLILCALTALTATTWAQVKVPVQALRQEDSSRQESEHLKTARQFLQASMRRSPVVNVRVIDTQRMFYNSDVFLQVKVEMSTDGDVHQIVLSPLSMQGTELVDDGRTLKTYTPDDKRLIEQPSAQQDGDEVAFRMNLVDQNYVLHLCPKETIAGRSAIVVRAVPRNDSLETRCYAIDDKTGFLLRLETCREGRPPMLHLDTKVVEFPAEFSSDTFKLDPAFSRTETFHNRCVSPKAAGELTVELGFQPAVPSKLPFGFTAQQLQASTDSPARALIVRVTDGLARATVLEWRKMGAGRSNPPDGTLELSSGGLTLLVSGDLPDEVKKRILRAFAEAARGVKAEWLPADGSWAQELVCELNVLPLNRQLGGMASTMFAFPVILRI